ncbi:uncharacterized protein LOC119666512 [Teleopsis dalmanni]|uniref:uncharacterized protein LOC119666512 n=1 Tax=Teleopsis dalmanni TaxID=139649 RepID=UPI0018CEB6B2|nr:uncharacterized protein LOC119666512 [Teleopsis dalmanni]
MATIEGDKKQEGIKPVSTEDKNVTKPLRNQRALIRVIEKTMKEIESTFEEPQQEVAYRTSQAQLENYLSNDGISENTVTLQSVKLPQITLPSFDGNPLMWVQFRDLFLQLIDEQPFKPMQKMFYLTTNLIGEPKNLIKHLPASTENYATAWQILRSRYDNKRLLITALLNKLLSQSSLTAETSSGLKSLHDVTKECILGLKAQGILIEEWDAILVHLTLKKLDRGTQTAFEQSLKDNRSLVSFEELLQFIESRFLSLEAFGRGFNVKVLNTSRVVAATNEGSNYEKLCPACKNDRHPLYTCKSFIQELPTKRLQLVKQMRLCINCLRFGHFARECSSGNCKICNKKHNSLLHLEDATCTNPNKITNSSKSISLISNYNNYNKGYVVLGTARVIIQSNKGIKVECRALLDSGSQVNLVTERLIKKLGENPMNVSACIEGIGQRKQNAQRRVNLGFSSKINEYAARVEAYVLPSIVSDQPSMQLDISNWDIPSNIKLADPCFHQKGNIDLLLGAEFSHELLSIGQIKIGNNLPILQNTLLGWIVIGKITDNNLGVQMQTCGICSDDEEQIEKVIEKFWQLDEASPTNKNVTQQEELCESHFINNVQKTNHGRFIVRLPFQQNPSILGESQNTAINRFYALERRLSKDEAVWKQYVEFMDEYEKLAHMSKIHIEDITSHYLIPHHCVIRPTSSSTKLRVVFDASCKTNNGLSLNDILLTGPKIQSELFSILLRFRCPRFAFCTDIEKMYRQILIHPNDRKYQIIAWRRSPNDPLQFYQLNTVTYGTRSAPYLATKCLQQLAKDKSTKYPLGALAIINDFYVDDCLSGSDSLDTALEIQRQLHDLLESAGFKLRKWCVNNPLLLQDIAKEDQEVDLDFSNEDQASVKTLGLSWQPKRDKFSIRIDLTPSKRITKRSITSSLAKIFDPLGILGPVLVTAKILIQDLWQLNLSWDEAVPSEVHTRWINFCDELRSLHHFQIDRHIFGQQIASSVQLHAFCDASEKAYGAAIYIRATLKDGRLINRLLCSKSRVAPLKKQTIPRLELCAALLGATLMNRVKGDLNHKTESYYWTDSEIVLYWINSLPAKHQQFVANRTAAIQDLSAPSQWRHVSSRLNPADALSRGIKPSQLQTHNLWFYGPMFLHGREDMWPEEFNKALCNQPDNAELKKTSQKVMLTATEDDTEWIYKVNHRNSFNTLLHIVGYVLRFIRRSKRLQFNNHTNELHPEELEESLRYIVKCIQATEFKEEVIDLKHRKLVKASSSLAALTPFLDKYDIVRVGGRLDASNLTYNAKHQMLLPYNDCIVKLLMKKIHEENMHCGGQALLAATRQKFWPIKGKVMARSIVQHCIRCTRCRPVTFNQIMGNLPHARVHPSRPFLNTGVDFCGPIWVHYKVRGKRPHKAYIAVFCCFATKAVHLELVSDLTTDAFIESVKRFVARRGLCQNLFCDNATNFVGANNKLNELVELIYSKKSGEVIERACSKKGIKFNFIPPRTPHFGGLWEAAVKSAKHLLVRSVATESLTYEELETVVIEIEAILNSRPITPMSNDPNDFEALTPGHFLIGEALTAPASTTTTNLKTSLLTRWKLVSHIKHEFWRRWNSEYLNELQYRRKWREECKNLQENTLVIMKDGNLPPLQWALGRVTNIHKGTDGMVRVVDVKTASGIVRRAIHN